MEKLSKRLYKIKAKYWSEVLTAEEFIDSVSNTIQMSIKEAQKIITNFSREEHEEFDQFKEFLRKAMAGKKPKRISVLHGKAGAWAWAIARPLRHESLVGEMALVYLISIQEAFLKDYMKEILRANTQMLMSRKQMSHEDICSHSSFEALLDTLARREVDELSHGGVDDFADAYERRFHLRFSAFQEWQALREASFRRNIVIHNRGRANETYRAKVGIVNSGKALLTDTKYIRRIAKLLKRFFSFVHKNVSRKFELKSSFDVKSRQISVS